MTTIAHAPAASVRTGWTVHVQVELGGNANQVDPVDDLAMALLTGTEHRDVAVVLLDDVVHLTWSPPAGDDVRDARRALVRGLDEVLALVTPHVEVARVRQAWVEGLVPLTARSAGPAA